jgi:hypothetical protein
MNRSSFRLVLRIRGFRRQLQSSSKSKLSASPSDVGAPSIHTSFNCFTFPKIPSTCPSFWLSNSFRVASLYCPLKFPRLLPILWASSKTHHAVEWKRVSHIIIRTLNWVLLAYTIVSRPPASLLLHCRRIRNHRRCVVKRFHFSPGQPRHHRILRRERCEDLSGVKRTVRTWKLG